MRFSEIYNVRRSDEDDWFDTYLRADTELYIDPFLIYDDTDPRWATAHDHILDFFTLVLDLIRTADGDTTSQAWGQAKGLLLFPEPSEFCLGVADGSPDGSGAGRGLQKGMLEGARTAVGLGMKSLEHMEMLVLFQGGMGLDRISDAVCNILKPYFVRYTQDVCRRHQIEMKKFHVRNLGWDEDGARWRSGQVELPVNPCLPGRERPLLLVPERFLRSIPVVTADAFWTYAWEKHGDDLRRDFNYDLARKIPRRVKAKLARQHPEVAAEYLQNLEDQTRESYPTKNDPKLLTRWYERGADIARTSPLSFVAKQRAGFPRFVAAVVSAFGHNVEAQDGWELLWVGQRPRPEKTVQQLFRGSAIHYCRANDIDLTGEANAGRGPVDFKFSRGWEARAVVEIKLMSNSKFWDGVLAQTPTYALAEGADFAMFVAVAYTDADLESDRVEKVRRAAKLASKRSGVSIKSMIIDARPKRSASKVKAPKTIRDELHGRDNVSR